MLNQGENWRKLKETLRDQIISNYQSLFRYSEYQSAFVCHFVFRIKGLAEKAEKGGGGATQLAVRLMNCSLKWGMTVSKRLPFYVIRISSQFKTRNITQSRLIRPPRSFSSVALIRKYAAATFRAKSKLAKIWN